MYGYVRLRIDIGVICSGIVVAQNAKRAYDGAMYLVLLFGNLMQKVRRDFH